MNSPLHFPFISSIPAAIMSNHSLEPNAKLLFGILTGLSVNEGYCWATNEQLADLFHVHISQIKRWLSNLETHEHVSRSYQNIPYRNEEGKLLWKKQRKIFVHLGISKKEYDKTKNDPTTDRTKNDPTTDRTKNDPTTDQIENGPINNKSSNLKSIKRETSQHALRLATLLFELMKENQPKTKKPNFQSWAKEIDKLLSPSRSRSSPYTEDEVEAVIRWSQASEFWGLNIRSGKKLVHHMDNLFNILAQERKNPKLQQEKEAQERTQRIQINKKFAIEWMKQHQASFTKEIYARWSMNGVTNVGVELKVGSSICPLGFGDHGFQEQLKNFAHKL